MLNQISYKNRTNYHHLFMGDVFTLLQLKNKLNEWGSHADHDSGQTTNRGWNMVDEEQPWDGEIPPVGSRFKLYTSQFFDSVPRLMEVVRVNHNLFQVVYDWN